jgi:hypothetical protein
MLMTSQSSLSGMCHICRSHHLWCSQLVLYTNRKMALSRTGFGSLAFRRSGR